jgi:hypothetical protein
VKRVQTRNAPLKVPLEERVGRNQRQNSEALVFQFLLDGTDEYSEFAHVSFYLICPIFGSAHDCRKFEKIEILLHFSCTTVQVLDYQWSG